MRNSFSTMALSSLFLVLLLSSLHVVTTIARATPEFDSLTGEANSISPKAYLVHYWDKQITNNLPKPPVLFSKASPLTAASAAMFTQLVSKGAISDHLLSFCEEAKLFCFLNSSFKGVAVTDNDSNLESADSPHDHYSFTSYADKDSNLESADSDHDHYSFASYADKDSNAFGSYADKDSNAFGSYADKDSKAFGSYADKDSKAFGSYADKDSKAFGSYADKDSNAFGSYADKDSKSFGSYADKDSNLESADSDHDHYSFASYADKDSNLESADTGHDHYSFEKYTAEKADHKNVNRGMKSSVFFRESMLKSDNVMSMPNLRDSLPKRSFLPRSISSKLPFSTSKLAELKQIFHSVDNSTMEKIMARTLGECEGAAIHGETKRCVTSIEDMINFATSILGHDAMVRSTEGSGGSKQEVLIGLVNRIKGAEVSKPVACHQNLFPYMVYYCHAFENIRIYEVDILDRKSKAKINHGVAICHMDTSAWAPTHTAFLTLGSGPGRIEVCHWAYENTMVWTIAE